ncbi:pseudouridylate synthase 7 homolog, partial [Daphnia carinata]|uniref:pseudouridylate synthase 7 homolog n=1 Tax=Daphnia carinata TaxID=120202 RepID=UPI0028684EA2
FYKKTTIANYSYLKDLAGKPQESGNCLKRDCEVGITEFVSQCQGFSAVVGHRFFDTQIHEISLDRSIVHLTTKHSPGSSFVVKRYPTEEEQLAVFEAEKWNTIEDMVESGKPEVVEIDVTGKSKAEKKKMQKILKMKYDDVVNTTVSVDGKNILKIFKKRKNNRQGRQQRKVSTYTQFVMYKENHTTMEALNTIAQKLKMESGCFTTAGTKDKKAITSQLVTVKNVEPHLLFKSMKDNASISVGNFSCTENPLRSGSLRGNRFTIALRNVIGDECKISANLNSLKEMGFVNYYEPQRFGTRHIPTHIIGKQLLLGKWKEAINLILDPGDLNGNLRYVSDVTRALVEYKSSNDAQKAFAKITQNFQTIEAKLLLNLTKCGEDVAALNTISRNIRVTYMRAYQCFIWNTIASKRLATFGLHPIIGDLVYATNNNKNTDQENQNLELEKNPLIEMVGDRDDCETNEQGNHRKVMFIDENNIHKYTVYDVVLPLPGYHTVYPANQIAFWYQELLQADGLTDADFSRSFMMFNLSGMYRYMVSKPFDLKWKFLHYDDPNATLIPSDRDRLKNKKQLHPAIQGSKYRGLVFEFSLSAFAFASMVIREITKMDMTTEFHANFKRTRENNQNQESHPSREGESSQIQFESCKSQECSKTPVEMKQMNKEPDVSKQHALATKKSCKGPEFEVNGVQSTSSQNSAISARMVPEEPIPRTIKFEPGKCEKFTPAAAVSVEGSQMITVKEEPGISKQPISGDKYKYEEPNVSKIWLEPVLGTERFLAVAAVFSEKFETKIIKRERGASKEPQPMRISEENKCQTSEKETTDRQKRFHTKKIKEEQNISETPTLNFGKSLEEPQKKRIKVEPVIFQDHSVVTTTPFKEPKKEPIIVVDLTSDLED